MVPRTIKKQLSRLRWRERWLRLTWGGARWLALALVALALACLIDFLIDRTAETPWALRVLLSGAQVCLWVVAAFVLILRPLWERLSNSRLALWVEERVPVLGHRLISTVQLNEPGAKIEGMSPELIAAVTRETEQMTARVNFPAVADHRRLHRSAAVTGPLLLAALVPLLLAPGTTLALLSRQLLQDVPIPRSVYLESKTAAVWPSGEEVVLKFRVSGEDLGLEVKGEARVYTDQGGQEVYDLEYESPVKDGAIYTARVRPMSVDFRFRAYLRDGRTPRDGLVHFEPRPVVVRQDAWVILPAYLGKQSSGAPYEIEQSRGEIVGLRGLSARVQAKVQKPVKEATLELLGTPYPNLAGPKGESSAQRNAIEALTLTAAVGLLPGPGPRALAAAAEVVAARGEVVLDRLAGKFNSSRDEITWTFDLLPTETAYRIRVLDKYDFANSAPPVRGIAIVPERAPRVALLRERFLPAKEFRSLGNDEDYEVDGMPLGLDDKGIPGPVRVRYTATGPYGLGHARLRYRVLKKAEGSQEEQPTGDERWLIYPLPEVQDPDPTEDDDRDVPFVIVRPEKGKGEDLLPRMRGKGWFDFETSDLTDARGKRIVLRPGDQFEFYVEVFNRHPDRTEAVVGRSETRVKTVVTAPEFRTWVFATLQEENRLRQLEARQKGVFDPR